MGSVRAGVTVSAPEMISGDDEFDKREVSCALQERCEGVDQGDFAEVHHSEGFARHVSMSVHAIDSRPVEWRHCRDVQVARCANRACVEHQCRSVAHCFALTNPWGEVPGLGEH